MRLRSTLPFLSAAVLMTGCTESITHIITPKETHAPSSQRVVSHNDEKPTPQKEAKFNTVMHAVAKSTQTDPKYNRIRLTTPEEKRWFKALMYRLWDRQITRAQFIAESLSKYPEHRYEFTYIANAYQNY